MRAITWTLLKTAVSPLSGMLLAAAMTNTAAAAVTQQEADQLGSASLTEFGAEKPGSADGSIPAYTGGLPIDTAPSGWKAGSGRYEQNPFENETPLFSINAGNMNKYADHLTVGTMALMKKFPDYRIDIYPTHRSIGYPAEWLSHCKTNATTVKLTETGDGIIGGHSCVAFPIPDSGMEVQWNNATRYVTGVYAKSLVSNWLRDGSGHVTDIGHVVLPYLSYWADPKLTAATTPDYREGMNGASWMGPPSQVGVKIVSTKSLDFDKQDILTWFYSPGQRRIRLAPEFAYDTPVAPYGGGIFYDEEYGFAGSPDRFDWKLVGKKEIYVPYNSYKLMYAPTDTLFSPQGFINPDINRFELHRVWVIESTLKPGKRHAYSRRTFYVDEDSWGIVASDSYDQGGKMYRVGYIPSFPAWDKQTYVQGFDFYDVIKSTVLIGLTYSRPEDYITISGEAPANKSEFSPDAMAGNGIR